MRQRRRRAVEVRSLARFVVRSTRRMAVTAVGLVLVSLGLAGLLLPVLPGWLLIVGGFAVLSREYYWAHSCLRFCRRHAAKGGTKLRTATSRRRRREAALDSADEVVIDLTGARGDATGPAVDSDAAADFPSSRAL